MSQAPPHFVSQADLTDAQKRREREIQEAYARIGEEPPPKPAEEAYDPRPLYERLREARALQDERIEVERLIAAEPARIFAVLTDPQRHVAIDSSGMLQSAEGPVVTAEGAAGRRRVAEGLAAQGWYSYADSTRPSVV